MTVKGDARITAAEHAAITLQREGHAKLASDVRALIRTYRGSRQTNSQLWRDNQQLRAALSRRELERT